MMKLCFWGTGLAAVIFIAFQVFPPAFGRTNPPVRAEPAWDSPGTRELVVRACFDCHSNETVWPWYSYLPFISKKIERSVNEGREELNYSEWDRPQREADDSAESVLEGKMPPRGYSWLHLKAWLTDEEKSALIRGLEATFGKEDHGREDRERKRGRRRRGRGRRGRDRDDGRHERD